jgi:hypothetical protein
VKTTKHWDHAVRYNVASSKRTYIQPLPHSPSLLSLYHKPLANIMNFSIIPNTQPAQTADMSKHHRNTTFWPQQYDDKDMHDVELGSPAPTPAPAPTLHPKPSRTCALPWKRDSVLFVLLITIICGLTIGFGIKEYSDSQAHKDGGVVARKNTWYYNPTATGVPMPTLIPMTPEELEILSDFLTRPGN